MMPIEVGPRHAVVKRVIYTRGSEYEQGYQHGFQLAKEAVLWTEYVREFTASAGSREEIAGYLDRYIQVQKQHDPVFLEQVRGIYEGVKAAGYDATPEDIDLLQWYWTVGSASNTSLPPHGCSSFAAWGSAVRDGVPCYQMNNDYGAYPGTAYPGTVAIVHYPEEGFAWMSVGECGKVVSNCGMNDQGLVGSVQYAPDPGSRETELAWGLESTQILYTIFRKCSTAQEAVDLFKRLPKAKAQNYLFMDVSGNTYVIEAGGNPEHQAVRTAGDNGERDFLVLTNHWICPEWKEWGVREKGEENGWEKNPEAAWGGKSTWYRYMTVLRKVEEHHGSIDPEKAMEILSSHEYWDGEQWVDEAFTGNAPCMHGINADGSLSASNFLNQWLPQSREVRLTQGNPCGFWPTAGTLGCEGYVRYQLKESPDTTTAEAFRDASSLILKASEAHSRGLIPDGNSALLDNAKQHWSDGLNAWYHAKSEEGQLDYLIHQGIGANHFAHAQAYARYALNHHE